MSFKWEKQMDRQTFVCIINVNSSYFERESKQYCGKKEVSEKNSFKKCEKESETLSIVRTPLKLSSSCFSRVPPSCLRKKCHTKCQNRNKNVEISLHRNVNKRLNRIEQRLNRRIHKKHRSEMHLKEIRPPICEHKKNTNKLLYPMSSSQFKDDLDYLYEDISTDSFDRIVETPVSYKNGNKHYCKRRRESKLDTLIRRTKERERRLVEQSRTKAWCTMSPGFYSNVSSEECLYSSVSDVSTFILERNDKLNYEQLANEKNSNNGNENFSNSIDEIFSNYGQEKCQNLAFKSNFAHEICHIKTEENNFGSYPYSTSSPKDNFFPKFDFKMEKFKSEPFDKYETKRDIQSEPRLDMESYSPVPEYFPSISVKLEPKLVPNMTWMDDGIAMSDYDDD